MDDSMSIPTRHSSDDENLLGESGETSSTVHNANYMVNGGNKSGENICIVIPKSEEDKTEVLVRSKPTEN